MRSSPEHSWASAHFVAPLVRSRGFEEVVGTSPTAYVRAVRPDRVHAELLAAPVASVTDIAMSWGFVHLGRFAQQYRERFGVLPSETLRRGPHRT